MICYTIERFRRPPFHLAREARPDGTPRDQERQPPLRRLHRRRRRQLHRRIRGVLHAARPLRLRQDDVAADDRRLRPARQRGDRPRRGRPQGHAGGAAADPHGVPELRAVSAHDGGAEHRLPAAHGRQGRRRGPHPGPRGGRPGQARQAGAALPARAVRRAEAAGRARPRAGQPAAPAAARRAAGRARRQAPRADADRADPAAAGRRRHLRLRHPLAGRGAGAVAPDRGDEPRRDRADGRAGQALRLPEEPLRRRLHRQRQHARGHGRGDRRHADARARLARA